MTQDEAIEKKNLSDLAISLRETEKLCALLGKIVRSVAPAQADKNCECDGCATFKKLTDEFPDWISRLDDMERRLVQS